MIRKYKKGKSTGNFMGTNLGRDQEMGLWENKNGKGRFENKPQHYHELHECTTHGEVWQDKRNYFQFHHQLLPEWLVLLSQASGNIILNHLQTYWAFQQRKPYPCRYQRRPG